MVKIVLHIILLLGISLVAMADKVGTWTLYPSYGNVQEVQEAGSDVYVLASGNLFSYHKSDNTLTEYMKEGGVSATGHSVDVLSSQNITHIAWVAGAKKLVIVFADAMIDILDAKGNVGHIVSLKEATGNFDKTVGAIYVSGRYAFLRTNDRIVKIDVAGEYVVKTYKVTEAVPDMPDTPVAQATYDGPKPDGPAFPEHNYVKYDHGRLLSVRGRFQFIGIDVSHQGLLQEYDAANASWSCYDNSFATQNGKDCLAQTQISVDPKDRNHVMVAARSGLYEYRNKEMVAFYDMNTDDPVISLNNTASYSLVSSTVYDAQGNLWVFNMGNTNILCKTASGEWKKYPQSFLTTGDQFNIKSPFIDSRGLLWFVNDRWKVTCIGFLDTNTGKTYLLTSFVNQDGRRLMMDKCHFTAAEDKEHNIWLGWQSGCYYLTPEIINAIRRGTDAENIRVMQHKIPRNDGTNLADYLLGYSFVWDIKIDAANRKWFATTDGVYVISSDCNTQIAHFTTENSPLPDNEVLSLSLDEQTGTVYMGTLNGLCSYQSDVKDSYGELTEDNVYAYPNPVTPDHTGDITIMGLTSGSTVKIATVSGKVMHEGTCVGGSYEWNGCDASGNKVPSGVYMVLVATPEGESGIVTKIAVVR